jgi:hypothetical protein
MAKAADDFMVWLSGVAGPLNPHQSRLVLGALTERLRSSPPAVRRQWHEAFRRWWREPTLLTRDPQFEETMQRVRQIPRPGRPTRPDTLPQQYAVLLDHCIWLASTTPTLTAFRRSIQSLQQDDGWPLGHGSLPIPRLYRLHKNPPRMVRALLQAATGTSVKTIRKKIKVRPRSAPPAP